MTSCLLLDIFDSLFCKHPQPAQYCLYSGRFSQIPSLNIQFTMTSCLILDIFDSLFCKHPQPAQYCPYSGRFSQIPS